MLLVFLIDIIVELVNEINNGNFNRKRFTIYGNNFNSYKMLTNRDIRLMVVKENIIKINYKYGDGAETCSVDGISGAQGDLFEIS